MRRAAAEPRTRRKCPVCGAGAYPPDLAVYDALVAALHEILEMVEDGEGVTDNNGPNLEMRVATEARAALAKAEAGS